MSSFSENGYVIIKNAIRKKTIDDLQNIILNHCNISNINNTQKKYQIFRNYTLNNKKSEFDFCRKIYESFLYENIIEKLLLEKKIYSNLTYILGHDLSFDCQKSNLALNLPLKKTKKNYFFKNWHQEIWSGSSPSSVQLWTPIFQKNNIKGQIELIDKSHKWGHVPHSNRKPITLPNKYKSKKLHLNYGDVIIFSTLLMHKSVETDHPRLALTEIIKNFKWKNDTYENNKNWKIFSYSEITKIERFLGNHYLSPFRILDIKTDFSGILKK